MDAHPKIFVFEHNKCGTTSLRAELGDSGVKSAHWKIEEEFIAIKLLNNMAMGRSIIYDMGNFDMFSCLTIYTNKILVGWVSFFRDIIEKVDVNVIGNVLSGRYEINSSAWQQINKSRVG